MKDILQVRVNRRVKNILFTVFTIVFWINCFDANAQVSFTQTLNADFYKGAYNDLIVYGDNVYLPYQATDVGTWLTTTVLPQTLMGQKAATWNNRYVYVVGGYNDLTYSTAVYRATLNTSGISSWTTLNPLPVGLRDHAVVIGTNTVYVLGGRDDSDIYDEIYYATINTDGSIGAWQASSVSLPVALWGHTAVYCNGYVYVAGGANTLSPTAARNNVYYAKVLADNSLSAFTATTNLPATRNGHSMVNHAGKVYVLGGFVNTTGVKQNTVYSATSNVSGSLSSWSTLTALPIAVSNHSSVIINGLITLLGGESGGTLSNSVYYADVNAAPLVWNLASNVMYDRTKDGAAFTRDGWIGFCGGENLSGTPIWNTRYANLTLSSNYEKNGLFISNPFYELGAEREITELTFITGNPAVSNSQIAYRTAGDDLIWGNWTTPTSTSPISVGFTDHYLQYKVIFTGDGLVTPTFSEMNLWTPGTELSGNLNALTSITLANSPYWVTGDVSFTSGTHTFEAGVVWNFLPETGLTVGQANVVCNGTSGNPVQFIGYTNDDGLWDGFYFDPNSDNGVSSQFNYVVIANGGFGSNNANLYCNSSNEPFLNHCTIRNADGNGIRLNNAQINVEFSTIEDNSENGVYLENSNPTFVSCDINNNAAAGVHFTSNTSEPTYSNTIIQNNLYGLHYPSPNYTIYPPNGDPTLTNNTYNGIAIDGGDVTSSNKVWNSIIYDYILLGTVRIVQYSSYVRLTIEPGNTIKALEGVQIQIGMGSNGGELYAIGTADSLITFTSHDGLSGGWDGIWFTQYASGWGGVSVMDYCVVEKGNDYNMYSLSTVQPTMNHSIIRDALVDGLRNASSTHIIQNTQFLNNGRYPYYLLDPGANPTHSGNTYTGNGINRIAVEGGEYGSDRSLTFDNIPYLVLNDIIIVLYSNHSRLTVDPGVIVEFAAGTQLRLGKSSNGGDLWAEGTSGNPITFRPYNGVAGGWEGIYFTQYNDNWGGTSSMKYCIVEKGNQYNIYCEGSAQPTLENCTIRLSATDGLREYNSNPPISSCSFENNGAYPINYTDWTCNSLLTGNSYSGNNPNYIALSGGEYNADRTVYNDGIPYRVLGNIVMVLYSSHSRLTVEPGVTLAFNPGIKLQLGYSSNGGDLWAEGTSTERIVFKPYNDAIGGWDGIYFTNYNDNWGGTSSMKYCNVEKAANYNILVESSGQPFIENCIITESAGNGLFLNNSTLTIRNCTFADNGSYGIQLEGSSAPVIGNDALYTCNLYGNTGYEIYNNTTNNINARYNYWGTGDSTMIASRIYDKYDNTAKGIVYFNDFAQIPSIHEPTMTLGGDVWYANPAMTPFDGATLEIFDFGSSSVASTTTNGLGHYNFGTVTSGNYTMEITPTESFPTGQVNSTDALAILQHFVQITPLQNIYLAAADVNASATVNGTDALFVQKRWSGMITSFPAGDWLYNTTNLTIIGNQVTNDFEMLAFGDVNASFTPAKDWNGSVTLLHEGTQIIQSFMPFELVVSAKEPIETGAISLGIFYPEEYMEITGAELLNTNGGAIFTAENGLCRIAWADLNATAYVAGDQLLVLNCQAKDLSGMQEPILVGVYESSEFADASAQAIENVTLTAPELTTLSVGMDQKVMEGLWLSTNYPNPFNKATKISYAVPANGKVKLTVVDLLGNIISELVNENQSQGEYSVEFRAEGLEPGIYIYKLEFKNAENNVQLVNKMSVTR
ncbi:MAG: right-handed parallel beta-helix repeat-containing protein [Bacteroidales bacterium]|nr:right-handed parallel beta-helix repeat-containing protein [Bacteroidales bacterium]